MRDKITVAQNLALFIARIMFYYGQINNKKIPTSIVNVIANSLTQALYMKFCDTPDKSEYKIATSAFLKNKRDRIFDDVVPIRAWIEMFLPENLLFITHENNSFEIYTYLPEVEMKILLATVLIENGRMKSRLHNNNNRKYNSAVEYIAEYVCKKERTRIKNDMC